MEGISSNGRSTRWFFEQFLLVIQALGIQAVGIHE